LEVGPWSLYGVIGKGMCCHAQASGVNRKATKRTKTTKRKHLVKGMGWTTPAKRNNTDKVEIGQVRYQKRDSSEQ